VTCVCAHGQALLELLPTLIRMPRQVLKECFAGIKFVCFRQSQACVERMMNVVLDALNKAASNPHTTPQAAANLADMLGGLVASFQQASFQQVSRQPFSDLGSVTSAHVRASDTLSTVSTSSEVSNEGMSYTSRGESTVATSVVTYISSTGHMDPDDSSAVGSHMDCASMDMDEDAVSIDEEEEMMRESEGLLDEEQVSPEEEEGRLASKVCSYTKTSNTFSEQHWYHCWTCGLTLQEGCCAVCAKVCHRGHDITYSRYSRFFCDCGAGKQSGHACLALHPRNPRCIDQTSAGGQSLLPDGSFPGASSTPSPDPVGDANVAADAVSGAVSAEDEVDLTAWLADCEKLPGQLTRAARETLLNKLRGSHVSSVLSNLYDCMVAQMQQKREGTEQKRESAQQKRQGALVQHGPSPLSLAPLKTVHSRENTKLHACVQRRSLKAATFALPPLCSMPLAPGSTHVQNTDASSDASGLRPMAPLSILSMSSGGMLAVAEGEKVEVFDVSKKMVDASIVSLAMDKTSIKLLSKTVLPFEPLRLIFNPLCPRHLAASGLHKCCVCSLSASGKVTAVVTLELSLEVLGSHVSILDVFWLPHSQVCLAVVTQVMVNIYDLSADTMCPIYSLRHSSGERIGAATPFADANSMGVLVMLQSGALYRFSVDLEVATHQGPCMLEHQVSKPQDFFPDIKDASAISVFYSLKSHILVCGYGTSEGGRQRMVVARLAPDASHVIDWAHLDMSSDVTASQEMSRHVKPNTKPDLHAQSGSSLVTAEGPAKAARAPRASEPCIDTFVDVGYGWGQLVMGSSKTGALGFLQVSNASLRVLWIHTPLAALGDGSALRVCGMAASSWTRPALAGIMILLEDGSLQHWALSEHQALRQADVLMSDVLTSIRGSCEASPQVFRTLFAHT